MSAADATEKVMVEIGVEEIAHLESLLGLAKALAAPGRLAILGALAGPVGRVWTLDELGARAGQARPTLERDVRQLAEAGCIQVIEWRAARPGLEPQPWCVAFDGAYLKRMPQLIATVNRVLVQARPAPPGPALDERTQTLARFMEGGRLRSWPAQSRRVIYILEAVAGMFAPGRAYTEREIDAVLKDIYAYDHCTLRRYLVDHHFLQRESGVYWRTERPLSTDSTE